MSVMQQREGLMPPELVIGTAEPVVISDAISRAANTPWAGPRGAMARLLARHHISHANPHSIAAPIEWTWSERAVAELTDLALPSRGRRAGVPRRWASGERAYERSKRLFDCTFAVALLVLISPVILVVAVLVRTTSPGPVLYRQTRCGRNQQRFVCYKFRSMVADADRLQGELRDLNELSGPVFKMHSDPRVTPVGRWLRKTSIDEIPQLWNVLRGDMSIVGPRPPLPSEVSMYNATQQRRLDVVPGLTCLWQVSGRSDISFDRWVELDLEYIRRRSLAFDLWLIVLTIPAVITGRGAF